MEKSIFGRFTLICLFALISGFRRVHWKVSLSEEIAHKPTFKLPCNNEKRKPCMVRHYDRNASSFVCVCNATYCDEPEPVGHIQPGHWVGYFTTPSVRFKRITSTLAEDAEESDGDASIVHLYVKGEKKRQRILGFGGAFTDAAAINWRALSKNAGRKLLEAYYGKNGIGYTIGRVPIASCDFSTHEYSYLDLPNDFNASAFALVVEDLNYKIPMIKEALRMTGGSLKLFGSPWSAPGWMKTNGRMKGGAHLRGKFNGKYYKTYAKYLRRFFEEYEKFGIPFWAVTIQNEPDSGRLPNYRFQTMYMSPEMQRDFAYELLAPELKKSTASEWVKIMAHDDQRSLMLDAAKRIYASNTSSVIAGLASHWYSFSDYSVLNKVHQLQPEKFILASEACTGSRPHEGRPLFGDWERGMLYGLDIINNLRNWVIGWTDWNLALDVRGGPNWVQNFVDAPIIVNATADEFYKQPMFYFLGHFSKFIPRGSVQMGATAVMRDVDASIAFAAFRRPDGLSVVVLINSNHRDRRVHVHNAPRDVRTTRKIHLTLKAQSITTIINRNIE